MTWTVTAIGRNADGTISDLATKLTEPLLYQPAVAAAIVNAARDLAASLQQPTLSAMTTGKIGEDGKGTITVTVTAS